MKRIILYIGIITTLFSIPVEQMNVGKLIPVQAVSIYKENDQYVIETDTENKGAGDTPELALQNLKDTASGTIYLDTAQYLLLQDDAQDAAEAIRQKLKKNVKLCRMETSVDMENVSKFLDAHSNLPKLKHWKEGMELPVLSMVEDSYIFLKKSKIMLDNWVVG